MSARGSPLKGVYSLDKSRHDARRVSPGQLHTRTSRTLSIPWRVCRQLRHNFVNHASISYISCRTYPSQWQTNNNIQSTRNEETSKVMNTRGNVRQQHGVSNNADETKDDAEQPTALHTVREIGRRHICRCAKEVARHSKELSLSNRPVTKILDDGGEESRKACNSPLESNQTRKVRSQMLETYHTTWCQHQTGQHKTPTPSSP